MSTERFLERYVGSLIDGQRQACRDVLDEAIRTGVEAKTIYRKVIWPALETIDKLYRADRINVATEHMATRISRSVADQLQAHLPRQESNGKRILITCADGEPEELGAQMCADLFESEGWQVFFIGGGVPNDEILSAVGQLRPDILLIFGTQPIGVANVRKLIDLVRQVGSNPTMNIMLSGGVFNRAEDLWKEVNADLFAATADEALTMAAQATPRVPQVVIPGAPKNRRRRRRPPLLVGASA